MKRLLNIAIILAMTTATLVGCSQEENWVPNELNAQENGSTICVNLNVSIPNPIKVESRAGVYDAIESMRIFCFNEKHILISTSTPDFTPANVEEGKSYELTANVTYTTRYVHLVANQNFDSSNYTPGSTTEDDIFANLRGTEGKMIYWARVEIPEGTLAKDWDPETVLMIRNQAKVTVPSNEHFTVEGFTVVNTFACGTVAPIHPSNGYPTNGSSTLFGVVGESNSWSATDYNHLFVFDDKILKTAATDVDENAEEMYIYESENPVNDAPSIIIKGKNPGETVSKYYRVTFTDNLNGGQLTIRRNHHYTVEIKGRMLYGSTTFNDALEAPSANNASLYIDPEVTAVGNTDFSLIVDDTKFVRISAPNQTLKFGFSIGKSGSYPLDENNVSVEWTNDEQDVSSTTTLSPVKNSLSTDNKWRYDLSIDLNELGEDDEWLEGTILIKYGHKLQRMVTVKVIPALQFKTKGYYSKDPADAYKDPLASLDFVVPADYPADYPFTVLISTGDFTVRKGNANQKDLSLLFHGDSGYGADNEFGYKYAYQVTAPGEHSIALVSHGNVQNTGYVKIESELFETAEYNIPLSGKNSKVWNNQFSLMVEQHDYIFITAVDEELKFNFEVEKLGEQNVEANKVEVVWGTEVLTPTLSSEGTKLKGELTVSLNDEDPVSIRALFIKYGDELQRKIMVISKPMTLNAEHVYYAAADAENKNNALASLNFTIPSYPNDLFPFNVRISSEHFKVFKKGGTELSKDSDNKYIYRVDKPGTYSVDLVSNGTATENGIVTLEAIDFETVICTIPLNQGSEEGE